MICPYDEQQCEYRDGGPGSCIRSSSGPSFDMQCYQNWRKDKGGSPSPEAEVLLKGQPHEAEEANTSASRGSTAEVPDVQGTASGAQLGDCAAQSGLQASEVGGSDTARLQQIRERLDYDMSPRTEEVERDGRRRYGLCEYCGDRPHHSTTGACDFRYHANAAANDVRAVLAALRTAQQERDKWQALALGCSEAHTSLRADVAHLTGERDTARHHAHLAEDNQIRWMRNHEHAEQQVRALRASIEQLIALEKERTELACDNDWGRACCVLWPEDRTSWCLGCVESARIERIAALLAAIKET